MLSLTSVAYAYQSIISQSEISAMSSDVMSAVSAIVSIFLAVAAAAVVIKLIFR